MKKITIAIDGPAGSGKGVTAKLLAQKLGYKTLDTGAMYRGIAYELDKLGIEPKNFKEENLHNLKVEFEDTGLPILHGIPLGEKIRTAKVGLLSSYFSSFSPLREFLIKKQQEIIKDKGYVLEGRDATTVIAPDAELKIYLDCEIDERVRRRLMELEKLGTKKNFEEFKQEIITRDNNDKNKGKYSLRIANNAIVVDTTHLCIEKQVEKIYNLAKKRLE